MSSIRSRELDSFLREVDAFVLDQGSFSFSFRGEGGVYYHLLNSFMHMQEISLERDSMK